MAKIIIVDDEYFVRMGIKSIVQHKEKGYIVTGEADNGNSAVKLILEQQPDIVFLDITMPGMDGIQVLGEVRTSGYTGYVAMLTCHEDFRLVQQAMRQGADDYVLKNELVGDAMLAYLDEVSLKLQSKLRESDDKTELLKQEEQHFYKGNFLKNILQIGGVSREEFIRGCNRYCVKVRPDGIYMITIYMKDWEQIVARYKDSDLQMLFSAVDNLMAETFRESPEWEGFYSEPNCYRILFTCSREKSDLATEQKIRSIVNGISYHFERILDIQTIIAVYRNNYPIEELHKGYQEAEQLLEQSFFWPERNLFWSGIQHVYQTADMTELEQLLENQKVEQKNIPETIKTFLSKQKESIIDKKIFFEILRHKFLPAAKQYGVELHLEPDNYEDVGALLDELHGFEEAILQEQEHVGYSFLVRQAIQIIKKDFTSKITLEEVAEQLGISAGYFSRIFSAETKETFSNYVIRKRIEYAKELITTTNYKFYEIAEMCGFSSSVHFNNTFKKLCNVTPNQYRKEQ